MKQVDDVDFVDDDEDDCLICRDCHDMKGGYGNDKFINGFDGLKIPDYIWPNVDSFIYFSHNFITIPSEFSRDCP